MGTGRLEAFSDGVVAIIITIMVLELKVPHGTTFADLKPLLPVFLSYLLSFIYVGIYWNNHHHMLQLVQSVSGPILWANLHLLFWLSLVPFVTSWIGENHLSAIPVALYGVVLIMAALAYTLLMTLMIRHEGPDSALARAMGRDLKGKASPVLYIAGIVCASFIGDETGIATVLALAFFVGVAIMWLVPDRRIERVIGTDGP
jgi:uncharacterized membrane protein